MGMGSKRLSASNRGIYARARLANRRARVDVILSPVIYMSLLRGMTEAPRGCPMKLVAAVAVLLLSTVGIDRLPAQELGPWGPVPARAFSLELARPGLEDVNLSFASFLFYPRVRAPVSVSVAVVGELPFARLGVDDIDVSGTILGNPYVGVEFVGVDGFEAGVGLRIPLGSEGGDLGSVGAIFAALADFDRFEAWIEKTAA